MVFCYFQLPGTEQAAFPGYVHDVEELKVVREKMRREAPFCGDARLALLLLPFANGFPGGSWHI